MSGLASCTAATIICSKQIAMIEVAFMAKENAGFCGFHTNATSSVKSKRGRRTCR